MHTRLNTHSILSNGMHSHHHFVGSRPYGQEERIEELKNTNSPIHAHNSLFLELIEEKVATTNSKEEVTKKLYEYL